MVGLKTKSLNHVDLNTLKCLNLTPLRSLRERSGFMVGPEVGKLINYISKLLCLTFRLRTIEFQ